MEQEGRVDGFEEEKEACSLDGRPGVGTEVLRRYRGADPLLPILLREALVASVLPQPEPSDLILVNGSLVCSRNSCGQPQGEPGFSQPGHCWAGTRLGRASLGTSSVRCAVSALARGAGPLGT